MKKKILFVIESLKCGGAEKSLVSLLPLLDTSKYEIYLWIMYRGGVFEKLLPQNIHLIQFDLYKHNSIEENLFYFLCKIKYSIVCRLNKYFRIKRHNAEILWDCMHSAYRKQSDIYDVAIAYQQGLPTYLLKDHIIAKKKIAWINADIFSVGYNKQVNYDTYKRYNYLVTVSDILKNKLKQQWPDLGTKMYTIYDIINPNTIRSLAQKEITETFPHTSLSLLTVGRLVKPKGYDLLLQAASILKNRNIQFTWYIIGEGPERTFIEHEIQINDLKDYVFLLGLKENPFPYMKTCDIYVQTSKVEGFGMTIAEAKTLNKPIISTNYPVIYNILQDKVNGLIVDMTGESLANGIQSLSRNQNLKESLIRNLQNEENITYKTEYLKLEHLIDEN